MTYYTGPDTLNQTWCQITDVSPDNPNVFITFSKIIKWATIRMTILLIEMDFNTSSELTDGTHELFFSLPIDAKGAAENSLMMSKNHTVFSPGIAKIITNKLILKAFPFQKSSTYKISTQIVFESD